MLVDLIRYSPNMGPILGHRVFRHAIYFLRIIQSFGKGRRWSYTETICRTRTLMIIDSRVSTTGMNGDATSPMLRSPSSMSASRPTVDSLLEELNTAVPNGWAFCVCVCVLINPKTMLTKHMLGTNRAEQIAFKWAFVYRARIVVTSNEFGSRCCQPIFRISR